MHEADHSMHRSPGAVNVYQGLRARGIVNGTLEVGTSSTVVREFGIVTVIYIHMPAPQVYRIEVFTEWLKTKLLIIILNYNCKGKS